MRPVRLRSIFTDRGAATGTALKTLALQTLAAAVILTCVFGTPIAGAGSAKARLLVKFHASATADQRAGLLAAAGGQQVGTLSDLGVKVVTVPTGAKDAALRTLRSSRLVSSAEPDGTLKAQEKLPSDPSFPQQFALGGGAWGWYTTHTTQAWDITEGNASAVIAILDTGMNVTSGLDDFNGQLVPGWNVLTNSSNTNTNQLHGTYVAGVAGAKMDNTVGSAGVCPQCKIMPVVVGTDSGASWSDIATGITWATDHGARVINMSWAGSSDSSTVQSAINYAHSKGAVLFAAAGNSSCDCRSYPAADQNVISVTGVNNTGGSAGDAYGSWVTLAAPDGDMTAWPNINGSPGYAPVGGTSMASPFAAGIAGLLLSANPGLTNSQVEQALEQTTAPVSFSIAYGRVDALAALQSLGLSDPQPSSLPVNNNLPQIMVETNGDWNYTPLGSSAPQPGQVLLRGQGSWTGSAPLSLSAVKWQRCDLNGTSCTVVATTSKYTVQPTDAGYGFKLSITVKNNIGSTTAESAVSQPVGGSSGGGSTAAPANTSPPTVSGTAQDGQTLSASTGSWSGSPTSYAYQWQRCDSSGASCVNVSGPTTSSYPLGSADVGSTMRVTVTASNAGGSAAAQSAPSSVVTAVPPQSTSPPDVLGTDAMGQTLQSSTGSWKGTAPLSYAYHWQRCDSTGASCANVSGATSSTYTLTSADTGSTIRVDVSASNSAGSASATSQPTAPVSSGGQSLTFSGTLNKNTSSIAFPLTMAAGEADATLTFSKGGTATVQLVDAGGTVVAKTSGKSSPLNLSDPGLAAGSYKYVITCSGYKGSFSFTLAVTAPGV